MENFNKSFIYFICAVSAMGGLLFGYDWVVIGGAKPFYEVFFGIADSPEIRDRSDFSRRIISRI